MTEIELMVAATCKPYLQARDEADSHDGATRMRGGVRARLQILRTHTHGPVRAAPSRAGNCCDAVATIEAVASACTAADRGPLARDFYAEMCRSERWDVRSKDMNKPTIEPCKASVMTLNGLLMPGIGVSNEPR